MIQIFSGQVREQKTDAVFAREYSLKVLCQHVVEAVLRFGTACVKDNQTRIGRSRACFIAHKSDIGKHFVGIFKISHHVLVVVLPRFSEIIEAQVGDHRVIFHKKA